MAFNNPLKNDSEDTSFERGNPLSQAAKNAAKATSAQAQKQKNDLNKAIVDQIYGVTTPKEQEQDVDQSSTVSAYHAAQGIQQVGSESNAAQSPEEQAKMARIRNELFGNYASKFKSASNTPPGIIRNDLDQDMEKARQERKQKEEERKREEEEEEQRKKEAKEKENEEVVTPAGKKTGVMFGKKPQKPVALRLAETKTEINRGTTG